MSNSTPSNRWRWILWPPVIAGWLAIVLVYLIKPMQALWESQMSDPGERGCAYVAAAIITHAAVMAFISRK